ncbi:MAG: MipA/OmpV family protein, partial [Moraxellaceae bacterium]
MKVSRLSILLVVCPLLGISLASKAVAEESSNWDISIGLGAGVRTNPVMDNSNIPIYVVPQIHYQADRFFIQNLDIGYTLYNNESQQLHLLATPGYDQVFFNDWDASNFVVDMELLASAKNDIPTVDAKNRNINKKNLNDRRMAALAGLEYGIAFDNVDIQLQALHDITDYYGGNEIRLAVSKNIQNGKHAVKLTAGANWQSEKTLNYFYGLTFREAPDNTYVASSGITTLLRFDWSYQLNEHWSLRLLTSYRHLSDQISRSPLVTDDKVITAF